ncbi:MAG: molecular chaperone TorD family protein [Planctomycetota bacterium]
MNEAESLAAVARLFGDLLLAELDETRLQGLLEPRARVALAALGIDVPEVRDGGLDELAADYHAAFLQPRGGGAPPVGSLWTEGRYEGALTVRLRELAKSAALEVDPDAVRDAPVDHLGNVLHLWAACIDRAPWVSNELAAEHLAWADAPLARVEDAGGFYGGLAGALRAFLNELSVTRIPTGS